MASGDNRQLAHNMIFVYARLIVTTVIGLLTTRYALAALGQSDYGLYAVVGGVIAILGVISTAMTTTTRRFVNVEMGRPGGDVNKVFNTCLVTNCVFALFLFALAETVGLFYIYHYLNVEPDKFGDALVIFHISTLTAAISMVNVPHQSLLAANERFGAVALIDTVTQAVRLGCICLLFLLPAHRLIAYAWIMCGVTLGGLLAYSAYCRCHWPDVVRFRLIKDVSIYKDIAIFNNYIALGATSYVARAQGSNMLINYFFGTLVNGAVSIAYVIEGYAIMVISNLTTAAGPQITRKYSAGHISEAVDIACRINRLSVIFMEVLVFMALIELPFYLRVWLGEIPQGCVELCQWTLISALVRSFNEGFPPIAQASGKVKWFQIVGSSTQCSVLIIGWLLFSAGYPPQSIIISFVAVTLLNFCITMSLMPGIISVSELKRLLRGTFSRAIAVGGVLITYGLTLHSILRRLHPLADIAIGAILAAAAVMFFGLTRPERDVILRKLKLQH